MTVMKSPSKEVLRFIDTRFDGWALTNSNGYIIGIKEGAPEYLMPAWREYSERIKLIRKLTSMDNHD